MAIWINASAEAPLMYLSSHGLVWPFSSTMLGHQGENAINKHLFVTPLTHKAYFCIKNQIDYVFVTKHDDVSCWFFVPFVRAGLTLSSDTLGSE